jgi:transcriptional regulator with XRE-family HTH domain
VKNLAIIRKRRGLTQNALALKTGIGQACISRLEYENSGARIGTIIKLAKALDVNIEALISGDYAAEGTNE